MFAAIRQAFTLTRDKRSGARARIQSLLPKHAIPLFVGERLQLPRSLGRRLGNTNSRRFSDTCVHHGARLDCTALRAVALV